MKKMVVIGFIIGMTIMGAALPASAFDNNEVRLRYAQSFSKQLNPDWLVYFYQEFNWADDGSHFNCHVHEPGVVYSGLAKWLDVSAAFVKVFGKSNDKWIDENVPYVAATLKWNISDWSISAKNRFEFDQKENAEDDWYYRPFITITPPIKLTRWEIQPYIADELFYNFDEDFLTGNEMRTGFSLKVNKNISVDLYYLLKHSHNRSSGDDDWETTAHIIATALSVSF